MDHLFDWLNSKPYSSRVSTLAVLAAVPVMLVAATALLAPQATPLVGCGAGVALFVAVCGWWVTVLSPQQRQRWDYKARTPLGQRRVTAVSALAVWVILLLLLGRFLPGFVMGTSNVFVILCLYTYFRATPTEAAEALAAYQASRQEQNNGREH